MATKEQEIQEWSKLYGRQISEEEFAEICFSLNGFFNTLKEWANEEERMLTENESDNKRSMLLPSPAK